MCTKLTFEEIRSCDLTSPSWLKHAHKEAVRNQWIDDSNATKRNFYALAQFAKRKGTNPGAYFVYLLRNKLWTAITEQDERAAMKLIYL